MYLSFWITSVQNKILRILRVNKSKTVLAIFAKFAHKKSGSFDIIIYYINFHFVKYLLV